MLKDFEITNFRTFKHLKIDRLGRVNLIVGKNGSGKTCLLEALELFASDISPTVIGKHLHRRKEYFIDPATGDQTDNAGSLFFGRRPDEADAFNLTGGMKNRREPISFTIEAGMESMTGLTLEVSRYPADDRDQDFVYPAGASLNGGTLIEYTYQWSDMRSPLVEIPSERLQRNDHARWWDFIVRSRMKPKVLEHLSVIAPMREIDLVLGGTSPQFLVTTQRDIPVPIESLGDGVLHLFQIICAALMSRGIKSSQGSITGFLLIDEIENGLHYSVHADMWRMVFRLAKELDIQIFATTHSLDCIRGFAEAVADGNEEDGLLTRLQAGDDEHYAIQYDCEDMQTAVEQEIEMR